MGVTNRQRGFTIIEISLFLAMTGLLFLIAIIGTGGTIRTVRFSDSGHSLVAYIQRQYDDIINGFNGRQGTETCSAGVVTNGANQTPGTSDCLLIGRLLVFKVDSPTITQYDVIGTEPANVDYSQSDTQLITNFHPQAVTASDVQTYDIQWGAYVLNTKRLSDSQAVTGLLLIRSPKSSRIISYTFKAGSPVANDLSSIVSNPSNVSQTTNFCVENADGGGLPVKIVVTDAPDQQAVQAVFDANSSGNDCNGV
jgi:type II secretory pathway pseudopilin PulG